MKKNRILLISANRLKSPNPVYPIGLAYIKTAIEENLPEMQIKVCDMNLLSLAELVEEIKNFKPSFTGISFRNIDDSNSFHPVNFIDQYIELCSVIRNNSDSVLIIGGAAFSLYPEVFFKNLNPDFGVSGEGENAIIQIINAINNNSDFRSIQGLVYKNNGRIQINPRTDFFNKLNLELADNLVDYYWNESGMLNIQTKRGCPYNCIYCSYPVIEGSVVRTLDTERIIHSLKRFRDEKKISYVFFTDSVFNLNRKYNIELAERMIKEDLGMQWGAYFSPHDLSVDELSLYRKAGLKHIEFGTESLSNSSLKNYGKHFTFEEVKQVSENCNKAGVYFAHFLILAGYGETDQTIDETFENSKQIESSVFFPFIGMRIYPGTKLREIAINEGLLLEDDDLLVPKYFISKNVNLDSLKEKAKRTGKLWFFPDEEMPEIITRMRLKKRKGPLWHLIR